MSLFPIEMWGEIIAHLNDHNDLVALSKTCKKLRYTALDKVPYFWVLNSKTCCNYYDEHYQDIIAKSYHRHTIFDWVASKGFVEILKRFIETKKKGCTYYSIDLAIKYRHYVTVTFLFNNINILPTYNAMKYAIDNDDLKMIKFLHKNYDMYYELPLHKLKHSNIYNYLSNHIEPNKYRHNHIRKNHNNYKNRICDCSVTCSQCHNPLKKITKERYNWTLDNDNSLTPNEIYIEYESYGLFVNQNTYILYNSDHIQETAYQTSIPIKNGGNRIVCNSCLNKFHSKEYEIECSYCHMKFQQDCSMSQGYNKETNNALENTIGISATCHALGQVRKMIMNIYGLAIKCQKYLTKVMKYVIYVLIYYYKKI